MYPTQLATCGFTLRLIEDTIVTKARLLGRRRVSRFDAAVLFWVHRQALGLIATARKDKTSKDPGSSPYLGVADNETTISSYQKHWAALYHQEAEAICAAFPQDFRAIHHIGSTSISGLAAKPIIDICLEVEPSLLPAGLSVFVSRLDSLGYRYLGDWGPHGGNYFAKPKSGPRTHAVRLYPAGAPDVEWLLRFADLCRKDPEFAHAYAETKIALHAHLAGLRGSYVWFKDHWIDNVIVGDNSPEVWGIYLLAKEYPTFAQFAVRRAVIIVRRLFGRPSLHPFAMDFYTYQSPCAPIEPPTRKPTP